MASISLPPISTLHRDHDPSIAHQMSQDGGPPPSRTLPFPYCPPVQAIPQPEYVQSVRPPYFSIQTPYAMPMARMPLPSSSDAANLMYNASRHSAKPKEVKRRTKTGCLTCRKRRIKCGEEKPQCRNCLKSKRDCAGYDHLQTPSSQSIQPAPTSAPAISNTASRSSYTVDPPTSPATSSHYNSATTGSPRDQQDYTYNPRSADLQLPNINQGYGGTSYPPQRYP